MVDSFLYSPAAAPATLSAICLGDGAEMVIVMDLVSVSGTPRFSQIQRL